MRRLLLVAVAFTIALGGLIDATVLRDFVGQDSVGSLERRRTDETGDPERAPLMLEGMVRDQWSRRYAVHLDIRELAPGARLVRERNPAARDPLDPALLVGIGSVTRIVTADLSALAVPATGPLVETRSGSQGWSFHVAPGPVPALVVLREGRVWHLVDARLLPESTLMSVLGEREVARSLAPPPAVRSDVTAPARAGVAEWTVHLVLLLAGGLLLPRNLRRAVRLPAAYLVGVALHGALGVLLIPGTWGLLLTVGAALLYAASPVGVRVGLGWRRADVPALLAAGAAIGLLVVAVRWRRALLLTPDSFDYWAGGAALADGRLRLSGLALKRGITLQSLHAAGIAVGSGGLIALGAVALAAGAVLVLAHVAPVALPVGAPPGGRVGRRRHLATIGAGAAVAGVLVSPQMRSMAAYLNSHVLLAAIIVALVVLIGRAASREERRALAPAVGALVAAIVLTRVEGVAVVGLILLGALAADRFDDRTAAPRRPIWRAPWVVLGTSGLVWGALTTSGGGVAPANLGVAAAGAAALLVAAVAPALAAPRTRRLLLVATGSGLWTVTFLLVRSERAQFVDVAVENLGGGAGGWGVLAPLLLVAGILGVTHTAHVQDAGVQAARFLLIGFIPVTLIAKLGDGLDGAGSGLERFFVGGGRVGWGDSVNRMWTHAVLVVVLLLVVAMVAGRSDRRGMTAAPRRALDLGLLVGGVWIALQWQPTYLPLVPSDTEVLLLAVDGEDAVGELAGGSEVRQRVLVPPLAADPALERHRPTDLCLDVRFGTYAREVEGDVSIDVSTGMLAATSRFRSDSIEDWDWVRTCIELPADARLDYWSRDTDLVAVVGTTGATVDRALTVISAPVGEGSGFGAVAALVREDGTVVTRRVGHLAVRVLLLTEASVRPPDAIAGSIASVLPWAALLLGGAPLVARRRR
jgi:hypothetical protein